MLNKIKLYINLIIFRKKWKKNNKNNFSYAVNKFDLEQVKVGKYTYGPIEVYSDVKNVKVVIGNYCSIGLNTIFLLGKEHCTTNISTYPFRYKLLNNVECESMSKGDIIVGDDVWFGHNSTVLSGVKIGQGAVIATGAVVTKDVPPYSIVAGVPAKVVKYRFDKQIISKLLELDYNELNIDMIKKYEKNLYTPLSISNVEDILDSIKNGKR